MGEGLLIGAWPATEWMAEAQDETYCKKEGENDIPGLCCS